MRAAALAVSGQRCELREVVLKAKPQGLLQASPKGTVPVLVLPVVKCWSRAWTSCCGRWASTTH